MILRKACINEVDICYQCMEDAKAYQRSLGFAQWHENYPTIPIIEEDIRTGIAYTFVEDGKIVGYCCIIIGDEPAYHDIEGSWKTERPYGVVHRMAFSKGYAGTGLSKKAFALIKEHCLAHGAEAIRIDTHEDNKVMQHILAREGFAPCGVIYYDGPKLAFEWDA